MNRNPCVLCGVEGIRQPLIQTRIVTAYFVPLAKGGKKVQRNMFSACKFHKKLWSSWLSEEEEPIAKEKIKAHMRAIYPDWNMRQCFEGEDDDGK